MNWHLSKNNVATINGDKFNLYQARKFYLELMPIYKAFLNLWQIIDNGNSFREGRLWSLTQPLLCHLQHQPGVRLQRKLKVCLFVYIRNIHFVEYSITIERSVQVVRDLKNPISFLSLSCSDRYRKMCFLSMDRKNNILTWCPRRCRIQKTRE